MNSPGQGALGLRNIWLYRLICIGVACAIVALQGTAGALLLWALASVALYEIANLALTRRRAGWFAAFHTMLLVVADVWKASWGVAGIAIFVSAYVWTVRSATAQESRDANMAALAIPTATALLTWAFLAAHVELVSACGWRPVVVLLSVVACNDLAAASVGGRWPLGKLAPRVSPHKSIFGSLAGISAGIAVGQLTAWLLPAHIDLWLLIALALAATLGDLWFSSLKRCFERRNYSDWFGVKGGVLDRIDSAVLPLLVLCLSGPASEMVH